MDKLYISRKATIYALMNEANTHSNPVKRAYTRAAAIVEQIPAEDVQPVKHGHWECLGHDDKTYWYRCSVCGHEEHDNMTKHDNYCSNCGARMDGENE